MKTLFYTPLGIALALFIGLTTSPLYVHGAQYTLYTTSGFFELLIAKGIIPEDKIEKARDLITFIVNSEKSKGAETEGMNADKVEIAVSQYIEQGTLEFQRYADIQGLLLVVNNISDSAVTLEATRRCQVVYRVYDEKDTLLYTSENSDACKADSMVTYVLEEGTSRLFEVKHKQKDFSLRPGKYRFEIEYPGYGKGERVVTVR